MHVPEIYLKGGAVEALAAFAIYTFIIQYPGVLAELPCPSPGRGATAKLPPHPERNMPSPMTRILKTLIPLPSPDLDVSQDTKLRSNGTRWLSFRTSG
jgi:hypothetical protein